MYPKTRVRGFDYLAYLASFFNLIEVNSTFYRIPDRSMCQSWARRVDHLDGFQFSVKLFREFTHGKRLAISSDLSSFKRAIEPLAEANRLTAVLVQFPWSFRFTPETTRYISQLASEIAPWPTTFEVRHGSWGHDEARWFLEENRIGMCGIDQPLIGDSVTPDRYVIDGAGAYFRLHGRNYGEWFKANTNRDRRYDYLYSPEELREWVGRVREAAQKTQRVHVVLNNHFEGQAVANALAIDAMLKGKPVRAPGHIKNRYTSLASFLEKDASPPPEADGQRSLFDNGN